jgi:hypothetical protein
MSRNTLRRYFRHGLFPQLIVFEAVARLGSVTRAGEELHLAQPTVSLQMKKLARTLELTLFQPRGRRLVLTPAGEALRESCGELLALFASIDARLGAFRIGDAQALAAPAEDGLRGELVLQQPQGDGVYRFELEIEGLPAIKGAALPRPRS